jgi:hypothetical protein
VQLGLAWGGAYFDGYIYEMVMSTSNGTSADRARLLAYLKSRWGVA